MLSSVNIKFIMTVHGTTYFIEFTASSQPSRAVLSIREAGAVTTTLPNAQPEITSGFFIKEITQGEFVMKRQIRTTEPEWEQEYKNRWRLRDYSFEERTYFETAFPHGSPERLQQIITRIRTDNNRYKEAATERPDMGPHFERLRAIGEQSIQAWLQYYEQKHNVMFSPDEIINEQPEGQRRDVTDIFALSCRTEP